MKMDDELNVQSAQSLFTLCSNKNGSGLPQAKRFSGFDPTGS